MSYWMTITPAYDGDKDNPKEYDVRYSLPGLGFACHKRVDAEVARLLEVAIKEGERKAKEEIRNVLGVKS